MAYSRQGIVAVTLKNSCDIKLFHHSTFKHLTDVNIFSTVAQKLSKCDEIIKQHKTGRSKNGLLLRATACTSLDVR